jgi:hypothetical protein
MRGLAATCTFYRRARTFNRRARQTASWQTGGAEQVVQSRWCRAVNNAQALTPCTDPGINTSSSQQCNSTFNSGLIVQQHV